jgi:sigma-B regulation protein RsbU (phosphoserine phosphatase)
MSAARILVVDDEPAMLRSVERILGKDHEVRSTLSSVEGLAIAGEFKPDIAIVDIRMSEMDGFELMNELKNLDSDIQVILMTGSVFDVDEKLTRAIREKAFYYINKPFDRQVLLTLVDRCVELKTMEDKNRRYVAHLEHQLGEVRAFQESMLPDRAALVEGFDIFAAHHPCLELAGDLYDYVEVGKGRVALLVADVVGHGASAAMLTGIVKAAFHSSHGDEYDPVSVVQRVYDGIAAFGPDRFVTLICARVSAGDGALEYVNAGHEGGLVVVGGGAAEALGATGPLISPALRGLQWQRKKVPWAPGSLLLLYTDGISEASEEGSFFGTERIHALARRKPAGGESLLLAVLDEVGRFTKGRPPADDMTLLSVRSH